MVFTKLSIVKLTSFSLGRDFASIYNQLYPRGEVPVFQAISNLSLQELPTSYRDVIGWLLQMSAIRSAVLHYTRMAQIAHGSRVSLETPPAVDAIFRGSRLASLLRDTPVRWKHGTRRGSSKYPARVSPPWTDDRTGKVRAPVL